MATRKPKTIARSLTKEEKRLQAIYAKSRSDFTAANLQKFTEVEEGVPFDTVLAKLERMHRAAKKKRA